MGILDDAIREHLELKRSHGASEQEIRQQEAEAFGPVRQDVVAEAPAAAAEPVVDEPAVAAEHGLPAEADPYTVHPGDHPVPDPNEHVHPGGSDPAWREDTDLFAEPAAPSQSAPVHHHEERHPALHDTDEHLRASSHAPEPVFGHAAGAPEAPVSPQPPVEEPPVEEPEPAGADDEDVLEETPEFLQDAPEHDRLWFEQRPPRDFDFGE
jgi:hypothetical protein